MLMFSGIFASRGEKACVRRFWWRLLGTPSLETLPVVPAGVYVLSISCACRGRGKGSVSASTSGFNRRSKGPPLRKEDPTGRRLQDFRGHVQVRDKEAVRSQAGERPRERTGQPSHQR